VWVSDFGGGQVNNNDGNQNGNELTYGALSAPTVQSFDDRALVSPAGQAIADFSALLGTQQPELELFVDASPTLYRTQAEAQEAADLVLAALTVHVSEFSGQSQVRAMQAGTRFTLTQHDRYSGDAACFTLTGVTHHAVNNLGSDAAKLLNHPELKEGTYRNEFCAIPASVPLIKGTSALTSNGLCRNAHGAGVETKSFRGTSVSSNGKKAAVVATQLASWLDMQPFCGLPKSSTRITGKDRQSKISGKTGIIYFENYWKRPGETKAASGDHIDLWNGSSLPPNPPHILRRLGLESIRWLPGPLSDYNFSDLANSTKILFWEIK
jgi:hypothetical protein